ncbi:hypothetical protein [Nocardioides marmoraquaticus]
MDDAEQPEPADRVRLVVRQWSDAQLRRAWATSRHAVSGREPLATAQAAAVREVLLSEWERRHPAGRTDWHIGELD